MGKEEKYNRGKDVFVLATGHSLQNLTDDEKEYINQSETYAVNDFLIHHKKINIYPKNWVYIDLNKKTESYLQKTFLEADYLNINWYISKEHKDILHTLNIAPKSPIVEILSKYSYCEWGNEIHKTLFWCSITGLAINIANILNPTSNIKVIGMDGGKNIYFHSTEKDIQQIKNNHNSCDWFKWGLPIINNSLNKRSVKIYNCNKNSQYVLSNEMEYSDIL